MKFTLLSESMSHREYWAKIGDLPDGTTMNVRVHVVPDGGPQSSEIIFYVVTEGESRITYKLECTSQEAWDYAMFGTPWEGGEPPL